MPVFPPTLASTIDSSVVGTKPRQEKKQEKKPEKKPEKQPAQPQEKKQEKPQQQQKPVEKKKEEPAKAEDKGGTGLHAEAVGTIQVCHRAGSSALDEDTDARDCFTLGIRNLTGHDILGERLQSHGQDCKHHNKESFYHK